MKIAVLGGSFDPPHLGHTLIARQVLEYLDIDNVWIMPVAGHAFDKKVSDSSHRFEMTKIISEEKIIPSDFEIKMGGVSRTINTLRKLKKENPNDSFTFIIGSDQLYDFKKWDLWQDLIKEFGLIIFPREIVQKHLKDLVLKNLNMNSLPSNIILLDNEEMILSNVSSSKIRKRVKDNKSIEYLVHEDVEKYIFEKKLYV